jgi:hypothetical protein
VGSILEYKWSIPLTGGKVAGVEGPADEGYFSAALADSVPEWDVQQPIYVHKAHFYWNPFSDLESGPLGSGVDHYVDGEHANYILFTQRLPAGFTTTRSPKGDYTLDIRNVPAFVSEANTPPEDALHYRVRFFYSPYNSAEVYWENETRRWSKQLNEFASQSSTIKDAARQITAGA